MYRINQIKLDLTEDISVIPEKIKKQTGASVTEWRIMRESIDARDKGDIKLVYTVDFSCQKQLKLDKAPDLTYHFPEKGSRLLAHPPVIIGFGPCGLFAALILADMGYQPIVLERGKAVEERVQDVERFWKTGVLNEESNVQFGEGGAGTFSDGKLTTGIKDPRIRKVLEEFAEAGGGEDLLYKQKPHIGTDRLRQVVVNLRKRIVEKGGKVCFQSRVTDFLIQDGRLEGLVVNDNQRVKTQTAILAVGHSARDTFQVLKERHIPMSQKPFSIGVRIQHPQELINKAQYGNPKLAEILGPAEYKLNHHCKNRRGVYTFCMCPGGEVIMAASQKSTTVTNGMSDRDRSGKYANSGLLVDVRTSDFPSEDVLAGVEFQEKYEKLAFLNGNPPVVTWGGFGEENPVKKALPEFAWRAIEEAMPFLGRKLRGFDDSRAELIGVETRSSSPVRILRDSSCLQSEVAGLYPAGEGAGYAGGIMSAAVDGIKAAEKIIESYGTL